MKKALFVAALLCVTLSFSAGTLLAADSQPSSKSAMAISDISLVATGAEAVSSDWQPILRTYIKTAEQKDLAADVAVQCGLYTRTLVKSKGAVKDTSTAEASVAIRVVMDDTIFADPGGEDGVVYSQRYQELSAVFQGILDGCLLLVDDNEDGIPDRIVIDEECLTPEEVELVLSTMAAHSFNFCLGDVGSGVHKIEVQAKVSQDSSAQAGEAEAYATVGKGAMLIEEIRFVKEEDGTPALQ